MMLQRKIPLCGISRHRMGIDGTGIRTLLCVRGCPLRCKYCINAFAWDTELYQNYTMERLAKEVSKDNIYFKTTKGGVTFGGGEPAMYARFITRFIQKYGQEWTFALETSLNVPKRNIRKLIPVINEFIVDIKSMNPEIYLKYTSKSPKRMLDNLELLARNCPEKVKIRIPLISGFNTNEECQKTAEYMKQKGFLVELFTYEVIN